MRAWVGARDDEANERTGVYVDDWWVMGADMNGRRVREWRVAVGPTR